MKTFEHVAPSVNRKSLTLDKFQEFIIVLMKLRLNGPFQVKNFHFISVMHFHFIYAVAKKIFTWLCYFCVAGHIIYSIFINNDDIICDTVRKEIIMVKKML